MAASEALIRDIAKLFVKYSLDDWRIVINLLKNAGPEHGEIARAIEEIAGRQRRFSVPTSKQRLGRSKALPDDINPGRVELLTKVRDELRAKAAAWKLADIRNIYLQSGGKEQLPQKRDDVVRALISHLARVPDEAFAAAVKTILEHGVAIADLQGDYETWFKMIYGTSAGWSVAIVRLPLSSAPIGEPRGSGATPSPPQSFPTLEAAVASARNFVQQGYRLRMTGPEGQDWDHQQIVGYLNGLAMKRPALRAEDGAKFYGRVDPVDGGRFRASCRAMLDYRSGVLDEMPEYFMCRSRQEGVDWITRQAAARGFAKWYDENAGT